ncbi:DNA replication/repair protein RecF [Pengzhenrongella frigida]|uniref:DNA replication and repair protein RecF n=1 Tax=Pengzhenrongella frigida TaxID=1259133 RepID=A0A4Q5N189_9MICO|nr:DNA replication/repair protein RecF [Cellulomonas sp. HLT2-17]RYV51825.1 DNA replication/repair protein RecF [Cellulomonas sp. HLT2-17]
MYVSHLSLADFRSYETVDLELDRGVTSLVGPNGQGKTNLVEALLYVATLGSHRVPSDAALIRSGADRAVVRARVVRDDRSRLVEIEITNGKANRARINRSPVPRVRDVLGILRTVMFAPEDLALVKGDPDGRRRFLDELAVLVTPRMAGVQGDYDRILRQRSALLKSAGAAMRGSRGAGDLRTLDVWDAKLAETGAQIIAARQALIGALHPHVAGAYEQVSGGQGAARITYKSSLDAAAPVDENPPLAGAPASYSEGAGDATGGLDQLATGRSVMPGVHLLEARLMDAMGRLRTKEIERGVCLVGPHRDDLVLELGDLPAKGYASHGESWSLALALRLASYRLLTEADGPEWVTDWGIDGEPVLVLDDVFAELDSRRRDRLADLVSKAGQVIVTAAVPSDVPEQLEGARIDVMGGQVTRVL